MEEPATRSLPPVDPAATASAIPATLPAAVEPVAPATLELPGFDVLEPLGEGGMGIVWKARQVKLNRVVALKMVLGGHQAKPNELIRFLAEAEAVAAIQHPNVVQVYEYGEADRRPFLAMEYLPGGSLADKLKRDNRLSPTEAAELIRKLAEAVQAAHDQQIVHRDLKPGNVLFDAAGEPRVTDFGLAKKVGGSDLTATDAILGTPAYMAPEQAKGESKFVGPQADVWALGVILYECLTGKKPFEGRGALDVMALVMNGEPERPRKRVPGLPFDLELICLKCLEKSAGERYVTAGRLAEDVRKFLAGEPVSVHAAGVVEKVAKWARRNPLRTAAWVLGSAAVVFLAFGATAFALWQQAARDRDAAAVARVQADEAHQGEVAARRSADEAKVVATMEQAEVALRAGRMGEADLFIARATERLSLGDLEGLRATLDRLIRCRAVMHELDDVLERLETNELSRSATGEKLYDEIFRRYGLDVTATEPAVAAEAIRVSPVRDRLVEGLDEWLAVSGDRRFPKIRTIISLVDPDPYRTKVRKYLGWSLRENLSDDFDPTQLPPALACALVRLIGHSSSQRGISPQSAVLTSMRRIWVLQPNRFDVNFRLAKLSMMADPPLLDDAASYYRAAIAMRPKSAATWSELGAVLDDKKDHDAAYSCHRRALELDPNRLSTYHNFSYTLTAQHKYSEGVTLLEAMIHRIPDDKSDTMSSDLKYNAACLAVLASTVGGVNPYPEDQRPLLRIKAHQWLRAAFETYAGIKEGVNVASFLAHWMKDSDLVSVREPAELAKLPVEERKLWEAFWADVKRVHDKDRSDRATR